MTWGDEWPVWLWLVANIGATYRLTRLGTKDTITHPLRRRVVSLADRGGGRPFGGPLAPLANGPVRLAAELATCPWCLGIWVSGPVVILTYFAPFAWSLVAAGLTFAAAAGWLVGREG